MPPAPNCKDPKGNQGHRQVQPREFIPTGRSPLGNSGSLPRARESLSERMQSGQPDEVSELGKGCGLSLDRALKSRVSCPKVGNTPEFLAQLDKPGETDNRRH